MDIVTPDGELQTISECSNPDLFWAASIVLIPGWYDCLTCLPLQVRGGGGGTWGVATSATYKAHPALRLPQFIASGSNLTLGRSDMETILTKLASLAPDLAELGFSGTFVMDNSSVSLAGYLVKGGIQKLQAGVSSSVIPFILSLLNPLSLPAISPFIETVNSTRSIAGKMSTSSNQYSVRTHSKILYTYYLYDGRTPSLFGSFSLHRGQILPPEDRIRFPHA